MTLSISVMKCASPSYTNKTDMVLYASLDASDPSESEFVLPVPIQLKSKLLQSQCSLSKLQQQLEELNYKCLEYERYIQR